jgi:histidine triad (HIT) family protein
MPRQTKGAVAAGAAAGACPFCAIVAGKAPAHLVAETASCVAFLDARPVFPGHVLAVPREHRATFAEIPEGEIAPLFELAQSLSRALESSLGAHGTFVALNDRVSQSVAHVHVHVVPRRRGDGLRGFFWPRTAYASDAEAAGVAARIRSAWFQIAAT